FPTTPDALQATTDGSDFYLMVLDPDASALAYGSFYGGTLSPEHVDGGTSRFDKDGIVYQAVCAGCWDNSDFPTTVGAWSNTNDAGPGGCNLGVFKLDFEQTVQVHIDVDITAFGACLTDSVLFNAVGTAQNWWWDLGDGTQTTDSVFTHLFDSAGVFTVTLIGEITGLCSAIDTATIDVTVVAPADLQPQFDAVPSGNCNAFQVELYNTSTGSNIYLWDFGDNTTSTQTNPIHTYPGPGDYTITLGIVDPVCLDTAYLTTNVSATVPGVVLNLPSPVKLCDGASVVLDAGTGYDSYTWSNGPQVQTITVDQAGDYSVEVTDGFCVGADTITVLAPTTYTALGDVHICAGESAQLAVPFVPDTVLWSNGEWSISTTVDEEGTFWYVAQDQFGCLVTDTVEVTLDAVATGSPIIPNVFTPNGDGKNERFIVSNIGTLDYSMDIYNRWGQKVYATVNSAAGWNGELDNAGDKVPDGTYFVIVHYSGKCRNEGPTTVTGHVTLLR
ncbi:MAG TPA: gliding motility-associated C-terminal domain-containing protein, partial [Flavobacteriales bacterium]|nr:gliding motility-associated C-terminal domain-containing protein [Flavobacteriales bacterium]